MTLEKAKQINQEEGFEEVIDQLVEEGWHFETKEHMEERLGLSLSKEYDGAYVYVDDMGLSFVINDFQELTELNILD